MRLASFLPMLLLFASPLAAQQNCQIFDLTASVVQFNQNTCEFFVVLDFQHSGTSNQFTVQGNGTNYGMFVYGQSAVVLGPFQSAPNGPAVLEFVVRDAVFLDCSDAIEIQAPVCNPGCAIHDLVVDVGDCDLNALTFWLKLDFTLVGTPVDSFEVFAAGGVHLGTYAIADLPVTVQNVPWSGNAFTGIKVCAIGNPDCCKVVEFQSPNCFLGCGIVDFQVDPSECLTDSTYKAKIDFGLINPSPTTDSFDLFINDQPAGTFGLNQLPLPVVVTTNGGATDVVRVCITDVLGAVCCREKVFDVPPCLAPCSIQGLTVETDSCTSDSTFGLWVNFHVLDSTAVDSFSLWGNGQEIGHFGLNQLPLHLPNFEWNGLIFNTIKVCTGNAAPCCKEIQFLAPDCLPFDSLCEITHLFVETGACTSDSTYKLFLNFNANNPGNGTFIVYANGAVLDTFDLTEAPLFIQNFPWNGGANDVVTVCIGTDVNTPGTIIGNCCKSKEFPVPACLLPCHIFDLQAAVIGDCDPVTNTYPVKINFHVTNPGNDFFDLYVNGQLFGTFPINQLPLEINVPTGNQVDVFKICINDHPDCCISTELNAPNCDDPCSIVDLHVETGDCNADSTYHLTLNFQVLNSNATQFTLFGNGQQIGVFNLNQLPLHIPNFPWDGQGPNDFLKVCLVFNSTNNPCCETLEFPIPDCLNGGGNCEIFDLHVDTGDCTGDSTYVLGFNFGVHNPTSNTFSAWANGQFLGSYNLNQLPVTIQNFPWNGGNNDVLKVCVGSNTSPSLCCEVIEFAVPDCLNGSGDCAIVDLSVITGDCTGDSTYVVKVDFEVINPPGNTFGLWGNGVFYGTYNVNQLPLTIQNFHWNGGTHDGIKVCFVNPNGLELCCKVIEFPVPDCLGNGGNCEIFDLHVDTGDCTSDSSYVVTFNFGVNNAPGNVFGVWANGQFLGMYGLAQLPLTIQNFPWNGGNHDVLKVCFGNNSGSIGCCETIEFAVPDCLTDPGGCEIVDLSVITGDCTSDSTYVVKVDFEAINPPGDVFGLWGNGVFYGSYNVNQLPLIIQNFQWNGGTHDGIKVCFLSPAGVALCCKTIEFAVPDCLGGGDCEITGMVVDPGACTSDSTYSLFLNFQVNNPPGNVFGVWANGVFLGSFNLSQLPLMFPNFPWNGGTHDVVKVCFTNSGAVGCCKTLEFEVPDCLGNDPCHIYDMVAVRTACLCGQFFVAINFEHQNGGSGGFDIVGNGQNYGNFPYNTTQPIILGPFTGDGTTAYEFAIQDHLHPDCHDAVEIGVVECQTPANEPGNGSSLTISPNPASSWVNVTAMLGNGADMGQATVKIYHADGRLLQSLVVANGAAFQLDVNNLSAGVFRLSIQSGSGNLEGSFTKQ